MVKVLNIGNAHIGFRNFQGKEGIYNKEGDRNFVIFLAPEEARSLEAEGWNIKWPKERLDNKDEEDQRSPYLPVEVSFDNYPAKVVLINGERTEFLTPDTVGMLDWADIINVDAVIRPYEWSVNGNSGVKAYLKAIYVTIETDNFAGKYGI